MKAMKAKKGYNNYIEILSRKFQDRLNDILPDYNFDYGAEFEIAICEILRSFLPQKYGVCRGHIVDFDGNNVGDDIIIYDQQNFPTLRLHDRNQYARKENIPIEAVFAYFELKHNLTNDSLETALEQIRKVKKFLQKRDEVDIETIDKYLSPLEREKTYTTDFPSYRNPPYCGIIGRKTELTTEELTKLEEEFLPTDKDNANPDFILFDNKNYFQIGYHEDEEDSDSFTPTLFLLEEKKETYGYAHVRTKDEIANGMFLMNLIYALDWIRLGTIQWTEVLNYYIQNKTVNTERKK